jgi:hypothetical protein
MAAEMHAWEAKAQNGNNAYFTSVYDKDCKSSICRSGCVKCVWTVLALLHAGSGLRTSVAAR